jgi:serine/threonine protein kinase
MPAPATNDELLDLLRKSGVQEEKKLDAYLEKLRTGSVFPNEPSKLAGYMVRDGLLTNFQAEQLLLGKWRRFNIGKYKVLERLGAGGMGSVYLCEHKLMRRRVAVKVLPTAKAEDPSSLERFYREARAVAALDHPNIVRAYDIDQDDNLHFLVMEYVDGSSLQEIGKKIGQFDVLRACHYIYQAALGLQHAHETAGLVHRDIKPGNILVDRSGVVKILDMGLARFFHDEEDILTKKYDENVLGTADYLAPEQALDSHGVDIRADIYSLGASFYFCLTGKTPFSEGTVAQKLIWHQTRQPKPIRSLRPEVPEEVVAVVDKMMAKEAGQRYQSPKGVMEALEPMTRTPIPPPPADEMPRLCAAAMGPSTPAEGSGGSPSPPATGMPSPAPRKSWQVSASPSSRVPISAPPSPPASSPSSRDKPAAPPKTARDSGVGTLTKPAPPPPAPKSLQATPRPGPNGQTIKEVVAPAEERVAWERLAPETLETTARADTAPHGRAKAPQGSGLRMTLLEYRARERRRLLVVLGVVAVVVVAAAIVTLILAFGDKGGGGNSGTSSPSNTWYVSRSGKDGAFKDLRSALRQAKAGWHVVVRDGPIEDEGLMLSSQSGFPKDVTLEVEPGAIVEWRLKRSIAQPPTTLLMLSHLDGFTLRGFTFDGEGRVRNLLALTGICPGVVLEDLKLRNFEHAAVAISNCQGTSERPLVIRNVQISAPKPEFGFVFDINPKIRDIPVNSWITIANVSVDASTKVSKQLFFPVRPEVNDKTIKLP